MTVETTPDVAGAAAAVDATHAALHDKAPLEEHDITLALGSRHIGTLWKHKSGQIYQITGVAIREGTGDLYYIYRPADRMPPVFFTRPAAEWNVPAEGDSEPRFVPYVYN